VTASRIPPTVRNLCEGMSGRQVSWFKRFPVNREPVRPLLTGRCPLRPLGEEAVMLFVLFTAVMCGCKWLTADHSTPRRRQKTRGGLRGAT